MIIQNGQLNIGDSIARFVMGKFLGYFRNLFLSWSVFIVVFLTILPAILIPSFLLFSLEKIAGRTIDFSQYFLYQKSIDVFVFFLENMEANIWHAVSIFFVVFPLVITILEFITRKKGLFAMIYDKYLTIICLLNIISISLVVAFNKDNYVSSLIGASIFFILAMYSAKSIYWISEFFQIRDTVDVKAFRKKITPNSLIIAGDKYFKVKQVVKFRFDDGDFYIKCFLNKGYVLADDLKENMFVLVKKVKNDIKFPFPDEINFDGKKFKFLYTAHAVAEDAQGKKFFKKGDAEKFWDYKSEDKSYLSLGINDETKERTDFYGEILKSIKM